MRSAFLAIILVFAHVAPPLLCLGGLISHACTETCCAAEDNCTPARDGDCGHEPDCSSDPCDELGGAVVIASRPTLTAAPMALVAVLPPATQIVVSRSLSILCDDGARPAACVVSEIHAPLLI